MEEPDQSGLGRSEDADDCPVAKLALLNCACQSYRYETAARPFPPQFRTAAVAEGAKDIAELRGLLTACCTTGAAEFLRARHKESNSRPLADDVYRSPAGLRRWLSPDSVGYRLVRRLPLDAALDEIHRRVGDGYAADHVGLSLPSLVYSVRYSDRAEWRFQERRAGRRTFYGYHGSRSDNIHSILANGLHAHLSYGRQPLYGEGVYLSRDMGVALAFAQAGSASPLGDGVQCVVVGEVIDDPALVRRKRRRREGEGEDKSEIEALASDFPDEYFVVANSDLVIVRHLLLFSAGDPVAFSRSATCPTTPIATWGGARQATLRLMRRHGAWLAPAGYALLLLLPRLYFWLAAAVARSNGEAEVAAVAAAAAASSGGSSSDGDDQLGWGVSWDA